MVSVLQTYHSSVYSIILVTILIQAPMHESPIISKRSENYELDTAATCCVLKFELTELAVCIWQFLLAQHS